jgi:hypothetical protein
MPADILLLLSPKEKAQAVIEWLNVLPLEDRGTQLTVNKKTSLAIFLFAAAILASAVGLIYLPIALGLLVVLYVLFGILALEGLYESIEWPVIVLLGSMIPLGFALENSGDCLLSTAFAGPYKRATQLDRPDHFDDRHHDFVRCAQQYCHHDCRRPRCAASGRTAGGFTRPIFDGRCHCCKCGVSHTDRA